MIPELHPVVEIVVDSLQYTRVVHVINEIINEDPFIVRRKLLDEENADELVSAEKYFEKAKRRYIERALSDSKQIDDLMNLPKWLGFQMESSSLETNEEVLINKAKNAAISIIWFVIIAKNFVGTLLSPEELKRAGIDFLIRGFLESDESRSSMAVQIAKELGRKGMPLEHASFDKSLDGYSTESERSRRRISQYIALIMIMTTCVDYDIDRILTSDIDDLINETTVCILIASTLRFIRGLIQGSRYQKPFLWPMTGDRKVCQQLVSLSITLGNLASKIDYVSLFGDESAFETDKTIRERTIDLILKEINEHYTETLKRKYGARGDKELRRFINLMVSQSEEIAKSVVDSKDQGEELHLQILSMKKMARSGQKPSLSPEKRYRDYLTSLEMKLRVASQTEDFESMFIREIDRIFGVTTEVINKYTIGLEDDTDAFTEALCFETSLRVLEYMKMEHLLLHLPWISRFIAEEAVNPYTEIAIFDVISEEHRTERIAAAYKAGLLYLILQEKRAMKAGPSAIDTTT
ncbi:MAG: hypothetical protein ACXABL_15350 [Candidatus Thorarchaeota archaeon]|jgi:hypothetical protein